MLGVEIAHFSYEIPRAEGVVLLDTKSPIFHGIYWEGSNVEAKLKDKDFIVEMNGMKRRIETVGWQASVLGSVDKHSELELQEDVFLVSGKIAMTIFDINGAIKDARIEHGVVPIDQMDRVSYTLALASSLDKQESPYQHFVLNINSNWNVPIFPLTTLQGEAHQTTIFKPSRYFVVKHRPV